MDGWCSEIHLLSLGLALVVHSVSRHTQPMNNGRIVWDSDSGPVGDGPRPTKRKRPQAGPKSKPSKNDGIARIRRETGGRKGKTVTTVSGIPIAAAQLTQLAKELKQFCGVGGSVKAGVIEVQGDQRERVAEFLQKKGHPFLFAGG